MERRPRNPTLEPQRHPRWRQSCFTSGFRPRSEADMKIGVFIPIGNNGWLISGNAPQDQPSFALNRQITLTAERYGLDFVLSMIKLRGFGGKTEFWDHNLESFTLMAGWRLPHAQISETIRRGRASYRHGPERP